jgi:hypothetical protein
MVVSLANKVGSGEEVALVRYLYDEMTKVRVKVRRYRSVWVM